MKKFHIAILLMLAAVASVNAGKIEKVSETVSPKVAKTMDIEGDLGAGKFNITTDSDQKELAIFDIQYDEKAVKYDVDYNEKGNKGYLTFESSRRHNINFDGAENKWDIVFSTKYESSLNLDIGACDAKIDLGGLPLKELCVNLGAASGVIEFSKPNPSRLEEFKMDAGASSLDMEMIGNANFSRFDFSGGVGSFDLDFRGEYKGESEINIEVGLGSADITLPANMPIRVETEGANWLSSVDFHHENLAKIDDGEYESKDFKDAKNRIILKLEVGLGSVDLYWKE